MPVDTSHPAPKARTARPAAGKTAAIPSGKTAHRESSLNDVIRMMSLGAVMRGWHADAGALTQHGPPVAHEIAALAESNEKIASWVDYLSEAGPYMGLAVACLPLLLQLAANHGKIDASRLPPNSGVLPPELLESEVKLGMERKKLEIEEQIRQAQSETAAMRDRGPFEPRA